MHELSIALSLVDLAQEEAEPPGRPRRARVHLRLGALAGVVKEALLVVLRDGVRGHAAGGIAAGDRGGAGGRVLPECQRRATLSSVQSFCCAECGTPTPQVRAGRELELVALEIEQ